MGNVIENMEIFLPHALSVVLQISGCYTSGLAHGGFDSWVLAGENSSRDMRLKFVEASAHCVTKTRKIDELLLFPNNPVPPRFQRTQGCLHCQGSLAKSHPPVCQRAHRPASLKDRDCKLPWCVFWISQGGFLGWRNSAFPNHRSNKNKTQVNHWWETSMLPKA